MNCHKFQVNKKIILFHWIFLLTIGISFAQNNFKNGYIITLENDTIHGQIKNGLNSKRFKSLLFHNGSIEKEFFPEQILGFGFENGKHFTTQIIANQFVEALVAGKISLYKSEFKFHITKDSLVFDLESEKEYVYIDGRRGVKDDNKWRGILASLISDCLQNPNEIVSKLFLSDQSLTKLVLNYNNCSQERFFEYKPNLPWKKLEIGATIGVSMSNIRIINKVYYFNYLAEAYSSIDPTMGIVFDFYSPKLSEKLSLQGEVHFQKSSYNSLVIENKQPIDYYETHIKLSTLSVPISAKYNLIQRKYGIYVQGGFNYNYQISSETKLLHERVVGNVVNTSREVPAFDIFHSQIGYWGGGELSKSFEKFKVSIAFRYVYMSPLNITGGLTAKNDKLTLNLILMKK